jgi:membrane protein
MANARERSRAIGVVLKTAASRWLSDRCDRLGAALAYYAIFSLFPLLLLSVTALGYVLGQEADTRAELASRVAAITGSADARSLVEDTLANMQAHRTARGVGGVIGLLTLLFGASSAFFELSSSLDTIWCVGRPGVPLGRSALTWMKGKLLSFLLVVAAGVVLLVWLVLGTALSALPATRLLPWQTLEPIASTVVLALTLGALYRVLPRARVRWADVLGGATVAAVLLMVLRHLLASYLVRFGSYAAYGVVGAVLALLLAIYLSSLLVFFGAEVAHAQAQRRLAPSGGSHGPPPAPPLRMSAQRRRPRAAIPHRAYVRRAKVVRRTRVRSDSTRSGRPADA